jgi:L-alanine-DL-glutamate epimerase-like enolase superfamily enzyme
MSSAVCSFASLHLAAAMPNLLTYEYMFIDNPLQKILDAEAPQPANGKLSAPERPGLGAELDEKKMLKYIV